MRNKAFFVLKILSLALCSFLLYWFSKDKDLGLIFSRAIGFSFIFLLLVTFLAQLFATMAWRYSFGSFSYPVSLVRLFVVRLCGESFAVVNPTNVIGGEAIKAMMLKRLSIGFLESGASLIVSRSLIILSLLFLMLIAFFFLFDLLTLSFGILSNIVLSIVFFLFCMLLYFAYRKKRLVSLVFVFLYAYFPTTQWIRRLYLNLSRMDKLFFKTISRRKLGVSVGFLLSMLHWLLGALEIYLILYFLGVLPLSFLACFLMEMGISLFKMAGSFIPGQIGIEEYGNKFMLDALSMGYSDTWLALSILRRARQVFWVFLGMVILPFLVTKKDVYRMESSL